MSNTAPLSQNETEPSGGPFLDWLDVDEELAPLGGLPIVAAVVSDHVEVATGTCFRTLRSMEHEGSFSSVLHVRSDGCRVRVSGNPSRWGLPENVEGLRSVAAGVSLYSAVLSELALPPLVSPALKRIDWAENLETGRGQERAVLAWCSGQRMRGRYGHLFPDGWTCDFRRPHASGGGRKTYVKYYAKGPELRKRGRLEDPAHTAWRARVAQWCDEVGLVRHEVTLRAEWMSRNGLTRVCDWTPGKSAEVVEMYGVHKRAEVSGDVFGELALTLMSRGVEEKEAHRCAVVARAWATGLDMKSSLSRPTYYRRRRNLLLAGIDIASAYSVERLRAVPVVVPVREARAPAWYHAERPRMAA